MVRETDFDTSGSGDLLKQIESQNIEIEPSLLAGYALIEIAAQAIKDDRPDAMGQTFNTIIGPLTFDAEGRAPPAPYGLFRWDGTGFTADSGN